MFMLSYAVEMFKLLKYIITKQLVICNLETDTDLYSNKKRMQQRNAKQFFWSVMHGSRYPI